MLQESSKLLWEPNMSFLSGPMGFHFDPIGCQVDQLGFHARVTGAQLNRIGFHVQPLGVLSDPTGLQSMGLQFAPMGYQLDLTRF